MPDRALDPGADDEDAPESALDGDPCGEPDDEEDDDE